MAGTLVHNIAKGRVNEYFNRVDANDPAGSVIVVIVWRDTSFPSDETFRDADTVAAIGATELSASGYARKILTDADVTAPSTDDTNNWQSCDLADQTWTAVAAGQNFQGLTVAYDPVAGSGTDSELIPLVSYTLASPVATNGEDLIYRPHTDGVFRAA